MAEYDLPSPENVREVSSLLEEFETRQESESARIISALARIAQSGGVDGAHHKAEIAMKPGLEHVGVLFRYRPTRELARLMDIRPTEVSVWGGGFSHFVVPVDDFDRDWEEVPAAEVAASKAAVDLRTLLLVLSEDVRVKALSQMDICSHCGVDERRPDGTAPTVRCQCWNDE